MAGRGEATTEGFFDGAYGRLSRLMVAVTLVTAPVLFFVLRWRFAAGFLLGAGIAVVNFYWLKAITSEFADVAAGTGQHSSAGIVAKSLLRYGLLAIIVYGIFKGSGEVVYGFFAGLFVPVAAMVCEAAYEAWRALRHDA